VSDLGWTNISDFMAGRASPVTDRPSVMTLRLSATPSPTVRGLLVALQPIGCEHLRTVDMTQLGDPAPRHRCVHCPAEWMDRRHRVQHWDVPSERVRVEPDPRISTLRPGWLADDQEWRDQLQAMDLTDARWVERHWDMAGGAKPEVDTSWVTYQTVGGDRFAGAVVWGLVAVMVATIAVAVSYAVGVLP